MESPRLLYYQLRQNCHSLAYMKKKKKKGLTSIFQESALTIMHCQHVKGYSLVHSNFSFLQHILQQQRSTKRHCFFILKSILLFAAADKVGVRTRSISLSVENDKHCHSRDPGSKFDLKKTEWICRPWRLQFLRLGQGWATLVIYHPSNR